eukprot:4009970-Amphidinium_carterae.1
MGKTHTLEVCQHSPKGPNSGKVCAASKFKGEPTTTTTSTASPSYTYTSVAGSKFCRVVLTQLDME